MTKEEVGARIAELAIVPAIRAATPDDALFAAEAITRGGLPIAELTMTVPKANELIVHLLKKYPGMVVGAGSVLNIETARACLDSGAHFITSPGFDVEVVEFTLKAGVTSIPGVMTSTEIMAAVKAGSDFVKIFPCAQIGGVHYLRALRAPFPHVPFIASGGVTQQTAGKYLAGGAMAVGIGADLVPPRAIAMREAGWIEELARRYVRTVKDLREAS